jgi:hypothetical protein
MDHGFRCLTLLDHSPAAGDAFAFAFEALPEFRWKARQASIREMEAR